MDMKNAKMKHIEPYNASHPQSSRLPMDREIFSINATLKTLINVQIGKGWDDHFLSVFKWGGAMKKKKLLS